MAEKVLLALSTFPDAEIARRISNQLVSERFAACANILPSIESIYRWKDKIESGNETLVLFKLSEDRQSAFQDKLRSLHPYDVPEIIFVPVASGLTGIPPVGCRELPLGALTFLASQVNCDANRVRNYRHDDDFRGETQRTWNVDDRVNRKKNSG